MSYQSAIDQLSAMVPELYTKPGQARRKFSLDEIGILLGMPLPGGMRLVAADRADIIPWGWGINGAFSVVGATLAVFIAMNWGFSMTLACGAAVYAAAALILHSR